MDTDPRPDGEHADDRAAPVEDRAAHVDDRPLEPGDPAGLGTVVDNTGRIGASGDAEDALEEVLEETFPASDPPASGPISGRPSA